MEAGRKPRPVPIWSGNPPQDGQLGKVNWSPVERWGRLNYDLLVRKEGRTTGETYGFVAGVLSSWKPKRFKTTCSEFFVVEERNLNDRDMSFARKGDSGSMVIDNEGTIVGMVMALVEIEEIQFIVHPVTKVPDILNIAQRRQSDGSVDTNRAWFESFYRCNLVLVEDARLIRQKAKIDDDPSRIIKDC